MRKRILVLSNYSQSGKTTLVEQLVGKKLDWTENTIAGVLKSSSSSFCYKNVDFDIIEIDPLTENEKEPWPEVRQLVMDADLILYVHPSYEKQVEDVLDDFFEEIDMPVLDNDIKPKRFIVYTMNDIKSPEIQWYEGLTQEQINEFEQTWPQSQNGSQFMYGCCKDFYLCLGLWLSLNVNDTHDVFDTELGTSKGFDELRDRILNFLNI